MSSEDQDMETTVGMAVVGTEVVVATAAGMEAAIVVWVATEAKSRKRSMTVPPPTTMETA
jgi:hypothetical protein